MYYLKWCQSRLLQICKVHIFCKFYYVFQLQIWEICNFFWKWRKPPPTRTKESSGLKFNPTSEPNFLLILIPCVARIRKSFKIYHEINFSWTRRNLAFDTSLNQHQGWPKHITAHHTGSYCCLNGIINGIISLTLLFL